MGRTHLLLAAVTLMTVGCSRHQTSGFPPPTRPAVLVNADFGSAFATLHSLLEARGMPVLMADASFGAIRTDWVYWDEGEVDLQTMADCGITEDTPPTRTRGRFAFDIRRRANRASVSIMTHWQAELHGGFDDSDRGYVDCRSTGEWERMVEATLTSRGTIR